MYFLVFEDSHRQAQFNLGYTWTTYWLDRSGIQPGLGFTAAVIQRRDEWCYDRAALESSSFMEVGPLLVPYRCCSQRHSAGAPH